MLLFVFIVMLELMVPMAIMIKNEDGTVSKEEAIDNFYLWYRPLMILVFVTLVAGVCITM